MRAINSPTARKAFWAKLHQDHPGEKIRKAIARLEEPIRSILIMHYYDGLTFKEISKRRNKSDSNTRGYHNRGMVLLVKILYPGIDSPLDVLHVRYH